MSMIRLTSIKIQDNTTLRAALATNGLEEAVLSTPRVIIESDDVHAAIRAKMTEALDGLMGQISSFAEENGKDGAAVLQAMQNNIDGFRLDAGGGYTSARKAELVAEGPLTADDFVPPKKGGSATPGKATVGSLTL